MSWKKIRGYWSGLWKNTRKMLDGYKALGFDTGMSETPIIPVVIKDPVKTYRMCSQLFEEGVFVNPIVSPAVPPGESSCRTQFHGTHTDAQWIRFCPRLRRSGNSWA